MGKLVYGVGLNDADYCVLPRVGGKQVACAFYSTWQNMIGRCYSQKVQQKNITYAGCAVCDDWLTFSKFKAWMEVQDWKGKQLDKDILVVGNKVYSPNTCAFVDRATNNFTTDSKSSRGELPIGVTWSKANEKFNAVCGNPFLKKQEHIGCFTCQNKAHEAWRKRKHELALLLADLQSDQRVANALRLRYA